MDSERSKRSSPSDRSDVERRPSRRAYVSGGLSLLGGTLLAGCLDGADDGRSGPGDDVEASTPTTGPDQEAASADESFSVSMAPMGEVTFEAVPERWMAYFSTYGDMGIALGQLDGLQGLLYTENWPLAFYDHLPDVSVSFDSIPQLMGEGGLDEEAFYELDCDVHLFDPNFLAVLADNWDPDADAAEIEENVGPIVGNQIRRRDQDWHDYRYYELYEAFEVIAEVFDERQRYEELAAVHDDLRETIASQLPPESERPTVGLISVNSDFEGGHFYAYPVHHGNGHKQYREVGMRGAFDEHIEGNYAEWDYETLFEVDPDVLLFQYGFSHVSTQEFERRMDSLRESDLGGQLSAVRNDRLYRGGTSYQGPIVTLFQLEAAAKQFYPDVFGEWPGLDAPVLPAERLFDYQRVADAIDGE